MAALGAAIAVLAVAVVLIATHGHGAAKPTSARYGGIPSWLPKATVPVNRTLDASAGHPVLTIQGDGVLVTLPGGGHVLATAVGPSVPEEGRFPVPPVSPTTFVVTLADASRPLAIDPAAFTLVDEQHHVHHPHVSSLSGGPAPREVTPGHAVSLRLYAIFPTGDGGVEWAPTGGHPLVAWDFTVEID